MQILETVLVAIGLSLDVCAVMICYGALLPEIKKRSLICGCVILSLWQLIALQVGNFLTCLPVISDRSELVLFFGALCSIVIFLLLGGYMFYKAKERKPFLERRKEYFSVKEIWALSAGTSVDTFFAGIGLGCLHTQLLVESAAVLLGTVAAIAAGIYIGYHFGYEQKAKAYLTGGVLMVAAGVEIAFRFL